MLGSLTDVFDAGLAVSYLADIREALPLYATVAHPGWLLRFANSILSRNVVLGPWIHVSSDVSLLGVLGDGELSRCAPRCSTSSSARATASSRST